MPVEEGCGDELAELQARRHDNDGDCERAYGTKGKSNPTNAEIRSTSRDEKSRPSNQHCEYLHP